MNRKEAESGEGKKRLKESSQGERSQESSVCQKETNKTSAAAERIEMAKSIGDFPGNVRFQSMFMGKHRKRKWCLILGV